MVSNIVNVEKFNLILPGTTTLGQRGPGSNNNEGVLHNSRSSRTRASPSDGLVLYSGNSLEGGLTPMHRCS